jgi:hypothetical protein
MSLLRTSRRTRRAWLPLALAALVFAQMLGLVHRVVHVPGNVAAAVASVPGVDAGPSLFGDHDDAAKCRLYDQLMHADLAVDAPVVVADLPAATLEVARHPAWHLAAQAAGFLARGPPVRG